MGILQEEIKFFKSTGNIGGAKTVTELVDGQLHDVLPAVPSAQAITGVVRYACFYVQNTNSTDTLTTAMAWLSANTTSAATHVKLGIGASGLNGTETAVADMFSAPAGVTFDDAENEANSLALPDLAPSDYHALWVEWTVNAGAPAIGSDSVTIVTKGDTPA